MTAKRTTGLEKLSSASFFTGIGGFDLGFERSGIKPSFQCEIDEFCRNVLEQHWPHIKRFNDIRDIDASSIPESQIWSGGFPCQDVSVARGWLGREGLKGQNSGLFYPFVNLIGLTHCQKWSDMQSSGNRFCQIIQNELTNHWNK